MLTKAQKAKYVEKGEALLKDSKVLVFTDFTGVGVEDIGKLRNALKEVGAKFKVIKKTLMRVALKKSGIEFTPEQFDSQVGTIFSERDISEVAGPVYKFGKDKEKQGFKILGAYDMIAKNFMDAEMVRRIGQLPSREVLLGQLVGMIAFPIKSFLFVLDQKAKKTPAV